ncbi:protein kinase domain protein, partial [Ichthyophthirius multifiliis]
MNRKYLYIINKEKQKTNIIKYIQFYQYILFLKLFYIQSYQHVKESVKQIYLNKNFENDFKKYYDDNSNSSSNNNSKKNIKNYQFITSKKSNLGHGAYSHVKLAIDNYSGKKVAIKCVKKKYIFKLCSIENLKREIKLQKKMIHQNICKLFSFFEDKQNVYLVLEYCEKGNLFQILKKSQFFLEKTAFAFFFQTCLAIDHLHKNDIIHRDLK